MTARYVRELRAATAVEDTALPEHAVAALASARVIVNGNGAARFVRHIAHLWCGAMLDSRCDTLLLPVFAGPNGLILPLDRSLEQQNRESGWGLPEGFFTERLESGACLMMLDVADQTEDRAREVMKAYPRCRYIIASGADGRNAGFGESGLDFGGAETRRVVIHG